MENKEEKKQINRRETKFHWSSMQNSGTEGRLQKNQQMWSSVKRTDQRPFLFLCDPNRKLKFLISKKKKVRREKEEEEKNVWWKIGGRKVWKEKSVTDFGNKCKIVAKAGSNQQFSYIKYQAQYSHRLFNYRINHLFMRLFPIKYFRCSNYLC